MTTLLLDADIIAFKVASVSQKPHPFCPGETLVDEWALVPPRIHHAIRRLQQDMQTDEVIVCLSCPSSENWRKDILPTYKDNRSGVDRPVHLGAVKDYMEANWPSYRRPRLEADDIMGILQTRGDWKGMETIIVSEDKDMKTVPGWLFNPAKDTKARFISPEEAARWHLYQTIVGDSTDGYTGCPGAGPEAAEEILTSKSRWEYEDHTITRGPRKGTVVRRWAKEVLSLACRVPSPWERLVSLFEKHGFTEADALVQARVARILHSTDYDYVKKKVIPWTPDYRPRR